LSLLHGGYLIGWFEFGFGFGDSSHRCWRPVGQCVMRSLGVVVNAPLFDEDLCLLETVESLSVQKFIPEAALKDSL
jgi:hypothetical protein